jgi:hypothetical protein
MQSNTKATVTLHFSMLDLGQEHYHKKKLVHTCVLKPVTCYYLLNCDCEEYIRIELQENHQM